MKTGSLNRKAYTNPEKLTSTLNDSLHLLNKHLFSELTQTYNHNIQVYYIFRTSTTTFCDTLFILNWSVNKLKHIQHKNEWNFP